MLSQLVVLCALTTPEPTEPTLAPTPAPETVESLASAGAAAPSSQAYTSGFSYNYLAAGFGMGDYDGLDDDSEAISLGASVEVNDFLFVTAGYATEELDISALSATLETDTLTLGLGLHAAMSNSVDIVGGVSYLDLSQSLTIPGLGSGSADGSGWQAGAGLRARVASSVELNGGVSVLEVEDYDDTILQLGTVIELGETIGLTGSFASGEDVNVLTIGIRVYL